METSKKDRPCEDHEHAWKGAWNRPMHLDESSLDAFTVARMTDHNVRGSDRAGGMREAETLPSATRARMRASPARAGVALVAGAGALWLPARRTTRLALGAVALLALYSSLKCYLSVSPGVE